MAPVMTNLVPEEERAVDSEVACEDKKIELAVVNPYAGVLSNEDLAVDPEEADGKLAEAHKKGFFLPTVGMAQLTNVLDGRYYARICVDEKGNRRIEICQAYKDGGYSPKITIKQSDFLRAAMGNFGEAKIEQKKIKNLIENFIIRFSNECLDKFDGSMTINFDAVQILKSLSKCFKELPIHKDYCEEQTPAELYRSVMNVIKEATALDEGAFLYGHKAYYPLTAGDVDYIATDLEMKRSELLKKLKEYNFLYLTESSVGYQTNVRIGTDRTERRYCLLRLEYLASK